MQKLPGSDMNCSHSPHCAHVRLCSSSESRKGHSSSWLSRCSLWRCVRRAVGFIFVWYEILSWAQAEWARIDSLRWSTTTKQLSGLHWQNEYWRRHINTGTGPSMTHHSRPGDWTLRWSLLSWFMAQSVKKSPNWSNRALHKSTLNRQPIRLNLS